MDFGKGNHKLPNMAIGIKMLGFNMLSWISLYEVGR